jgi:pimeloyl-ACP methyl ester carboxylesterase
MADRFRLACWCLAVLLLVAPSAGGYEFVLRNGMVVRGKTSQVSGVAENPLIPSTSGPVDVRLIQFVDDGLRRTFFSKYLVESFREDTIGQLESIAIPQPRIATTGRRLVSLASIVDVGAIDEFGRRTFSLLTPLGRLDVVQAITEITPVYTRLEGMLGEQSVIWDMRIATSSLPLETLQRVVERQAEGDPANVQLSLIRLLMQAERYQDAATVLHQAMARYPELKDREPLLTELHQQNALRLVQEMQLRKQAGQHRLVTAMASNFPVEGIAGETLQRVREIHTQYQQQDEQIAEAKKQIQQLLDQVAEPVWRGQLEPLVQEIHDQLSYNNVPRMADYYRLAAGTQVEPEQRLAWALSGWLLGPGNAIGNLAVTRSLVEVRSRVVEYLRTAPESQQRREELLAEIREMEGGTPEYVAQLVAALPPPVPQAIESVDSLMQVHLEVPSSAPDSPPVSYILQLPPDYDPFRRYPLIVTLSTEGVEPEQQIAWWAGDYNESLGMRMGQSTRRGYMVLAPKWWRAGQSQYEYSVREHAAVLDALRHAMARFSIDTDRVFLSGHGLGGDAAWDIGLAHPDLWAGVIAIGALSEYGRTAPGYVNHYWPNARYVPLYFVFGELDSGKLAQNARNLDRYLKRVGYDVMVVEYRGRGREHFHEEIQRIFDWMDLHRRQPAPKDVEFATMRPWDNFFWCLELGELPPAASFLPFQWELPGTKRPATGKFKVYSEDNLIVRLPSKTGSLWLSPDWVSYRSNIRVDVDGRARSLDIRPDVGVILEDARTRGDRQHPFWSRTDLPF